MTYIELQKALKEFRDNGTELTVKLNAPKELLQAEYDRLTAVIITETEEELVIERVEIAIKVKEETRDNYWSIWDNQYSKALTKMSSDRYKDTCDLKHEQIGLVLVAACFILFEITFTELSKAYQFIYGVLRTTNLKQLVPSVIKVYQNV